MTASAYKIIASHARHERSLNLPPCLDFRDPHERDADEADRILGVLVRRRTLDGKATLAQAFADADDFKDFCAELDGLARERMEVVENSNATE